MFWFIVFYGITAMGISAYKYLRCSTISDYILGNRNLSTATVSLASQTAILGFIFTVSIPMSVADNGVGIFGAIFSVSGAVCGMFLSRFLISRRIRIYSELANNSKSFPEYLENRFMDRSGILRAVCAAILLIFNMIFAAKILSVSASIIDGFTDMGNISAILICGLLIAMFIFLGGFSAITATSHIKAMIMFLFFVFILVSGVNSSFLISGSEKETAYFAEAARIVKETEFFDGLEVNILRFFSYAILFFGIPTINTVYMSSKERRIPKRKIALEFAWAIPSAIGSVLCGVMAKALANGSEISTPREYVILISDRTGPIVGPMIMSLIFVICLSTSEHAIFSAATSLAYDLFAHGTEKKSAKKDSLIITRICAVLTTFAAVIYALLEKDSIFFSFDFILTLISVSFGPTVLFGLYCSKITAKAAVISIAGGLISTCVFNYFLPIDHLPVIIGMIPSFAIGTGLLFAVSLLDRKNISKKTDNEFGRTKEIALMK